MARAIGEEDPRAAGVAAKPYVRWEEVLVSGDKGRRVVHYYLKDAFGSSDLAVVGREKTARHMSYDISPQFLAPGDMSPSCSASAPLSPYGFFSPKLKSRREVVDWLSSFVPDYCSYGSSPMVDRSLEDEDVVFGDVTPYKGASSGKMRRCSKAFSWLGFPWTCRKQRKHYKSFCRNGIVISVHDFVFVMGEENKRLVAYVEDLYEDIKFNNMTSVRWFHKVDEVGIALPLDTDDREIFFTLCLQELSVECIDGLAAVLSNQHFLKYLSQPTKSTWEPFLCRREIDNDDIKPFDISQVQGYWNQEFLRCMYTSPHKICSKLPSRVLCVDELDNGGGLLGRPKRKNRFDEYAEDAIRTGREKLQRVVLNNGTKKVGSAACLPRKEVFKQKHQQQLHVGCHVEVLSQDSGLRGCWFRCVILKRHQDKVKVRYRDIQDADGTGSLEEWLLLSRVAVPDTLDIRMKGRLMVRPCPSPANKVSSGFCVGAIVDAWWHDCWWEGIVIHRDSEQKIHIFFPGESRTAFFSHGELRHSQEWACNQWNQISDRPELASSLQRCQDSRDDGNMSKACLQLPVPSVAYEIKHTVAERKCTLSDQIATCFRGGDNRGKYAEKMVKTVNFPNLSQGLVSLKWSSSRKRSKRGNSRGGLDLERLFGGSGGSSQNDCEDSTIGFGFSLPKPSTTADAENCKLGGDSLFNPPLAMSNLVMTR